MAIDTKHPCYSEFIKDWQTLRDTYRGERVVKEKGLEYLPATTGMIMDGMTHGQPGLSSYNSYKQRAVFHEFVADAVEASIGMMHRKPPTIELPAALEPMRDRATLHGEPLHLLLRRINEQQLVTGRIGLLLDLPNTPDPTHPLPYIATYIAENIINWDEGARDELTIPKLNLVVLNESEYKRGKNFDWVYTEKYRLLQLGELEANEAEGTYFTGIFRRAAEGFAESAMVEPSIRGNTLDQIPFVFINTKDVCGDPDDPPLLGLAKLALAVYRGEADYRQNLFMQGQDTLVVIGGTKDESEQMRVGSGTRIDLMPGGDAKYIGVNSQGLSEQRQALENDKMLAANKAGQVIDNRSAQRESGEALRIRVSAQSATLNQIALTGAAGLERLLKIAAQWVGANPDEVKVTPNLDFADDQMTGKAVVELMTAKTLGAPLSLKSLHTLMQDKGLTKLSYEEETDEIESEAPAEGSGTDAGGNPEEDELNADGE